MARSLDARPTLLQSPRRATPERRSASFGNCLQANEHVVSRFYPNSVVLRLLVAPGRVLGLASSRQRFVRCGQWSDHGNATRRRTKSDLQSDQLVGEMFRRSSPPSPPAENCPPVNRDHAREHERKSEFCFEVGNETRNPPGRGHVPIKCWRVARAQVAKKPNHKSSCVNRPADALGIWHPTTDEPATSAPGPHGRGGSRP